ncbi:MAG: STAS domain-containing protein [Phycisphaerales bacterium]|nr:MAG: STAS domain-containing protein [Phycisphaerales bacterium]
MEIQIDSSGPFPVANITGELVGTEVERFAEELHELVAGQGAALAVVLSSLDLIDSKGLAALMNLVTRARLSDGKVVLVKPSAFVEGIFNVTRLDTWFDICDNLEQAGQRLA